MSVRLHAACFRRLFTWRTVLLLPIARALPLSRCPLVHRWFASPSAGRERGRPSPSRADRHSRSGLRSGARRQARDRLSAGRPLSGRPTERCPPVSEWARAKTRSSIGGSDGRPSGERKENAWHRMNRNAISTARSKLAQMGAVMANLQENPEYGHECFKYGISMCILAFTSWTHNLIARGCVLSLFQPRPAQPDPILILKKCADKEDMTNDFVNSKFSVLFHSLKATVSSIWTMRHYHIPRTDGHLYYTVRSHI